MKKLILQPERLTKFAMRLVEIGNKQTALVPSKDGQYVRIHNQWVKKLPICMSAIAEISTVFPEEWKSHNGQFYWVGDNSRKTLTSACYFFGLNLQMFYHLFVPMEQNIRVYGGTIIENEICAKGVAYNILQLIKSCDMSLKLHPEIKIFISKN